MIKGSKKRKKLPKELRAKINGKPEPTQKYKEPVQVKYTRGELMRIKQEELDKRISNIEAVLTRQIKPKSEEEDESIKALNELSEKMGSPLEEVLAKEAKENRRFNKIIVKTRRYTRDTYGTGSVLNPFNALLEPQKSGYRLAEHIEDDPGVRCNLYITDAFLNIVSKINPDNFGFAMIVLFVIMRQSEKNKVFLANLLPHTQKAAETYALFGEMRSMKTHSKIYRAVQNALLELESLSLIYIKNHQIFLNTSFFYKAGETGDRNMLLTQMLLDERLELPELERVKRTKKRRVR